MTVAKPDSPPNVPHFSSGPCAKRPGWNPQKLKDAALGRSHRAKVGKAKLKLAIELTREVLEVPADYKIGIVPASDTGAVEMALWSLLGARPVNTIAWEILRRRLGQRYSQGIEAEGRHQAACRLWRTSRSRKADPASESSSPGTAPPQACACPMPTGSAPPRGPDHLRRHLGGFRAAAGFAKLDVVTFSWQKALGGEAAHGMLILSPRAVERLQTYKPAWPLPKIFRLTKGGKLNEGIFEGETINTPSMLCVEDYLDALNWAKSIGGLKALIARADANTKVCRTGRQGRRGSISWPRSLRPAPTPRCA